VLREGERGTRHGLRKKIGKTQVQGKKERKAKNGTTSRGAQNPDLGVGGVRGRGKVAKNAPGGNQHQERSEAKKNQKLHDAAEREGGQ